MYEGRMTTNNIKNRKAKHDHGRSTLALHPTRSGEAAAGLPQHRQPPDQPRRTGLPEDRPTQLRHARSDRDVPVPIEDRTLPWKAYAIGRYWLSKRPGSDNWYIFWYDPAAGCNRRKSTLTDDIDRAKLKLASHVQEAERPQNQNLQQVPLADVFAYYLETRLTEDRPSRRQAEAMLQRFIAYFDEREVFYASDLKPPLQRAYMDAREAQGIGNNTITREMGVLKAALRWYHKQGFIETVPHIWMRPKGPPRERILTREEAKALLQACEQEHLRLFVLLSLSTLARPSAILGLHKDQIDLVHRRINFLPRGQTQTKKKRPVIPMTDSLYEPVAEAVNNSETGFVIEYRGRPVRSIKRSFRNACNEAGLGKDVVAYTLRHTGASWMAAAGVDMHQISGYLGHSHARTTELYLKYHPSFLADACKAIGDATRDLL
jgi:integrase